MQQRPTEPLQATATVHTQIKELIFHDKRAVYCTHDAVAAACNSP
jgi:hypothetical protein